MNDKTFVIVGASLAAPRPRPSCASVASTACRAVGTEQELPYERPPLSKDYLRGESERDGMQVHDQAFYKDQEIELRLGTTAAAVDTATRSVELGGGTTPVRRAAAHDRLEPARLQLPGAELDGIHYLRTIADSDAIRARIGRGGHLAVIGGGWIGSEVAASARQGGVEVTMVSDEALPNARSSPGGR